MTTKTTPKITLWEFFQQLGKNVYVARRLALVLRHYARYRQLA